MLSRNADYALMFGLLIFLALIAMFVPLIRDAALIALVPAVAIVGVTVALDRHQAKYTRELQRKYDHYRSLGNA